MQKKIIMKTKIVALLAILSLTIVSCNAVDDMLTFNIAQQSSFTVNSTLPINAPLNVATPDVTTNSSEDFKNNNTKADLVKDVKLTALKLTITDPSTQDFSFLKSVHVFIATDNDPEIELAFLDDINSSANTLNLTCSGQKLDNYIKASSFKLRTAVTTKKVTTQDVSIKADMNFKVTADPIKAL